MVVRSRVRTAAHSSCLVAPTPDEASGSGVRCCAHVRWGSVGFKGRRSYAEGCLARLTARRLYLPVSNKQPVKRAFVTINHQVRTRFYARQEDPKRGHTNDPDRLFPGRFIRFQILALLLRPNSKLKFWTCKSWNFLFPLAAVSFSRGRWCADLRPASAPRWSAALLAPGSFPVFPSTYFFNFYFISTFHQQH